jgi:hypothetical protein
MGILKLVSLGKLRLPRRNRADIRYALVSEQGKGQPKYVRMRGQTVEEVVTRSEYTSAVSLSKPSDLSIAKQIGNRSDPTTRRDRTRIPIRQRIIHQEYPRKELVGIRCAITGKSNDC